jgi:hypothetical protein
MQQRRRGILHLEMCYSHLSPTVSVVCAPGFPVAPAIYGRKLHLHRILSVVCCLASTLVSSKQAGARVLSCLPVVEIQQGKTRFDDRGEKAVWNTDISKSSMSLRGLCDVLQNLSPGTPGTSMKQSIGAENMGQEIPFLLLVTEVLDLGLCASPTRAGSTDM